MKHAYLIMPYNNFEILKKQIALLDYPENDLFIHMDAKTGSFDEKQFTEIPKYSRIFFIPRKNLYWADYSQVDIVLDLINFARDKDNYCYYHLLSGVDLPIKTQQYIHNFLDGKDEILLAIVPETLKYSDDRVKYYYLFLNKPYYRKRKSLKAFNLISTKVQRIIGVNRLRNSQLKIYNGWDWGSLPNDFAEYLLNNREEIFSQFKKTLCPIELVYHSYAYNSDVFRKKIRDINDFKNSSLRYIDWKRGCPYTFQAGDFEELINSNCLFARKFDESVDFEIVEKIYNFVIKKQTEELESGEQK